MKKIIVAEDGGERLDVFISSQIPGLSRSEARRLIESGKALVNGRRKKPRHAVLPGESIELEMPEKALENPVPRDIPLDILYRDEHVMVINKPAGMAAHPAPGSPDSTLVNALLGLTRRLSALNGPLRRGIVHRLDKDTTGALVVARTDEAHACLAAQFRRREVKRVYRALVMGGVEPISGEIDVPVGRHGKDRMRFAVKLLGGREAVTRYRVVKKLRAGSEIFSLLEVVLKTGRTHQIRVHFASIGHPVCGDRKYGKKSPLIMMKRQALHAEEIAFRHPTTGKFLNFRARLPDDFREQIETLEKIQSRSA